MPEIPDLSAFHNQPGEPEAEQPEPGEEETKKIHVLHAFIVVRDPDGSVKVLQDINQAANLIPVKQPDGDDLLQDCAVITSDVQAQKVAAYTALQMQQVAQAQMQQMQNAHLASQLDLKNL